MMPDWTVEERNIGIQAMAGLLWSKQYYYFDVKNWLAGVCVCTYVCVCDCVCDCVCVSACSTTFMFCFCCLFVKLVKRAVPTLSGWNTILLLLIKTELKYIILTAVSCTYVSCKPHPKKSKFFLECKTRSHRGRSDSFTFNSYKFSNFHCFLVCPFVALINFALTR